MISIAVKLPTSVIFIPKSSIFISKSSADSSEIYYLFSFFVFSSNKITIIFLKAFCAPVFFLKFKSAEIEMELYPSSK